MVVSQSFRWWCLVAVLYSIPSVLLFVHSPSTFSIADERAMSVLTQRIAFGQTMGIDEPLNTPAEGLVHPRSMTTMGTTIVPEGFIGQAVLYGWLAHLFGWQGIPYILLSLSTVLAAWSFGRLLRYFFTPAIAATSSIAYLLFPPVLYYSFHPFVPNLLQFNLLLIATALVQSPRSHSWWNPLRPFIVGVIAGTAVALRPVELPWIVLLGITIQFVMQPKLTKYTLVTGLLGLSFPLIVLGISQAQLYGQWWSVGYAQNPQFVPIAHRDTPWVMIDLVKAMIFPFGTSLAQSIKNVWYYHLWLFWWILPLAFTALSDRDHRRSMTRWLKIIALPAGWLIVFYGSWNISEQVDPSIHPMSTGFVRYWIPLAVAWVPIVMIGVRRLLDQCVPRIQFLVIAFLVVAAVLSPLHTTIASIHQQWDQANRDRERIQTLIEYTPANALLLVKYSDKVYFPTRRVLVWYKEPAKVQRILPKLIETVPVYMDVVDEEGQPFILPSTVTVIRTIAVSAQERLLELGRIQDKPSTPEPSSTSPPLLRNTPLVPLSMPFTSQAPEGIWDDPYAEYCEEASIMMAAAHFKPIAWNVHDRMKEFDRLAQVGKNFFLTDLESINSEQTSELLREAYPLNADVLPYSRAGVQEALSQGFPVLVPLDGALLGNPFFRTPPPVYHMLVIKGFSDRDVITNDPGTRRGESFRYAWDSFEAAIGEWNGSRVDTNKKNMIIVKPL